jgi:TonB family protein
VSLRKMAALLLGITIGMTIAAGMGLNLVRAQEADKDIVRRAKSKVEPAYPDLARKMNITGIVKVQVVVAPNGAVKEAKVIGGHPVLAGAALEAVKKWRFEPAATESTGVVEIKFEARQ